LLDEKSYFCFKIWFMKKIFGVLVLMLLSFGCDDGEITIENIDFSDVTADDCGNKIFKLKDTEALFFEVENIASLFANDITPDGAPRTVPINAANRIFYRAYSGDITSDNICGSIPPATPSVIEEWTFTGGNIQVTTTAITVNNTDPDFEGGQKIQQYRHNIKFVGVTKNTPQGSEILDYDFGFYNTTPNSLPFNFDDTLDICGNIITNINGSEALSLDIDPTLIASTETPVGEPRIGYLGTTTNKLLYSLFQSAVTTDYFCVDGSTPLLKEQWTGDAGVEANASGIIEVTTTGAGSGVFQHEIHLKNVIFRKGNSTFKLADDYILGLLLTN
jgi:hypothetical protein